MGAEWGDSKAPPLFGDRVRINHNVATACLALNHFEQLCVGKSDVLGRDQRSRPCAKVALLYGRVGQPFACDVSKPLAVTKYKDISIA